MTWFYQHSPFFPFTITTIITTYRPRTLNCYISFFLPNDANLDKNDAVSRRAASLFRTLRSIYHHLFLKKKQPTLRIQKKLTPKKAKKKKNYGILDYYKFLSANHRHSFIVSAIINHTIKH